MKTIYAFLLLFLFCTCQPAEPTSTKEKKIPPVQLPFDALDHELFVLQNYQIHRGEDTFKIKAGIGKVYKPDSLNFKINGIKLKPDENGWVEYQVPTAASSGVRSSRVTTEYIDPITKKRVKKTKDISYVISGRFGIENEHGKYLYRGISSKCRTYLDFDCGSGVGPIVKAENGVCRKIGSSLYELTPNADSSICRVKIKYCRFEVNYEYKIMDIFDVRKH